MSRCSRVEHMQHPTKGEIGMGFLTDIISAIVNMGATVMMPIIFIVLGLLLGLGLGKSFKAGMLVGIGFVGINLIIGMMLDKLGPAAQAMVERFGLNLTVIDVGWPVGAAIGWGTPIMPIVVAGALLINIVMLLLNLTKTVNIDIFNYWHFLLTGGVAYAISNSVWLAVAAALTHFVVVLLIADWTAPQIQKEFNLPGISFAHGTSAPAAPVAIALNWVFDRIPGLNSIKADPKTINEKLGILGEPLALGTILGVGLGILAGFSALDVIVLGIYIAAVMVLLPAMINVLVQGLTIIREAAEAFLKKKWPNRTLFIGMDTALLVGDPAVLATGLLLIPISLLLAILLPGNRMLPFVDLASLVFLVAMTAPFLRMNLIRTLLTGTIIMIGVLYFGSDIAPGYTVAASGVQVVLPAGAEGSQMANIVGGPTTWLGYLLIKAAQLLS